MNTSAHPVQSFTRHLAAFFGDAQARAVGLVFATESLVFGSWVAHIPHVKDTLQLSDAQLGMTLFAMPAGLITMNPLTAWIVGRLGQANACFWAAIALCCSLLVPVNATNVPMLVLGLYLVGLCSALINVAMNTLATDVEKANNVVIMSSCHGMWSVGGIVSSLLAGIAIANHVPPGYHVAGIAVSVLLITFLVRPTLVSIPVIAPEKSASFVKPNLDLLLMIFIGLAVAMGEGLAFDWSAVYLRDTLKTTGQVAALGFGAFSLTMTLGRFMGDAIIPRIGAKRCLVLGGLVGASGLVLAVAIPLPAVALLGFALLGAGSSLGAPILYSAALRVPNIPPAAGLATFATFSFVGFLAGPPIIGFIAEGFGLNWGLLFVACMLLGSALVSRFVTLF
ncbi:MFS transporter [Fibrivirga algicola]|uniref:MFS transporter n=1 Tax=Fibrivirga algicola TaxID=2950420 RepID=A0ABX0QPZ4_9BACT|nr:MFS transporter [Fibrivirga algicola]ARK12618.1 MFS transporter [Fibrella sp. ES10-3-2-2]NID12224.1 MFS transporter [Fibrivirga algicola]